MNKEDWGKLIEDLATVYRDVEVRSLSVPAFSITPAIVFMWNELKLFALLPFDILIVLPANTVIFCRNVLPGRWPYLRVRSPEYFGYIVRWLWRGEAPYPAFVAVRPLARIFLRLHIRGRLQLLRHRMMLDPELTREEMQALRSTLDALLRLWPRVGVRSVATVLVPVAVTVAAKLYESAGAWPLSRSSTSNVVAQIMSYSFIVLLSAFMIKRGLLLGAAGRAVFLPGGLSDRGAYGEERRIFESIGLSRLELPIDLVMMFLFVVPGMTVALFTARAEVPLAVWSVYASVLGLLLLALFCRMRLQRA